MRDTKERRGRRLYEGRSGEQDARGSTTVQLGGPSHVPRFCAYAHCFRDVRGGALAQLGPLAVCRSQTEDQGCHDGGR